VTVEALGLLVVDEDDDVEYEEGWESNSLRGKIRVIHHMAGRASAKEIGDPWIMALRKANFPKNKFQTVTIINIDDSIFGTGRIVASKTKDNAIDNPASVFVTDDDSTARKKWGLKEENFAVIIIDKKGKVLKFKEGKMSSREIKAFLKIIKSKM